MIHFDVEKSQFVGPGGVLRVSPKDQVARKLAMLIEGECGTNGPKQTAQRFGFCRQRYHQIRTAYADNGAQALVNRRRGPKRNYRRTHELVCQTIRHRFLDPDASSGVIAQKLRQTGFLISKSSVDRIFAEYGLQKKTLSMSARPPGHSD